MVSLLNTGAAILYWRHCGKVVDDARIIISRYTLHCQRVFFRPCGQLYRLTLRIAGWLHHMSATSLMLRLAELLERNYDTLATLKSLDIGGANFPHARHEEKANPDRYVFRKAGAELGRYDNSQLVACSLLTIKAPVRVVRWNSHWNAPLTSMWTIIGGILVTGCTGVIKTAEDASGKTLRTGEQSDEGGVPQGVFNVVIGLGAEARVALAAHMDLDRLAFTGSTTTGREIIKASAANMKRIQRELGGKSPGYRLRRWETRHCRGACVARRGRESAR
jgi:acyl-CoA reductase-like NAD-dependent aldehyde dehydrogenase